MIRTSRLIPLLITLTLSAAVLFGDISPAFAQTTPSRADIETTIDSAADAAGTARLTGAERDAAIAAAENSYQNTGCSIIKGTFTIENCFVKPLIKSTTALLLSFGASILELSGAVFDFGVNHVITNFRDTLDAQTNLIAVINEGWTFFRDIANILIIGIFVFIAISLILGLKEFGQKKLVARVLIIAVLMNFSLLFTKIIIDASNFVAFSIYKQTIDTDNTGVFKIADKILKPLKVTGVWNSQKIADQVYAQEGGGAWRAFGFGIFGFLILVLLAAVIFYGAFLILARAIMLIILMLTAPIAYASYLSPNLEASNIGWSNWWRSLINNAAFAPLMMIFLTISILIMQTASVKVGTAGALGSALADPSQLQNGWKVLFIYILGTGLLYVSFRLSSSLAGSISGINLGQSAIRLPLAFGAAMGFRGAGFAAQRTVGAVAAGKAQKLSTAMDQARIDKDWKKLEELRKKKALADKAAGSSFNLMNTQLGKALAKGAGLGGPFTGEGKKGGFNAAMHDAAAAAEAKAKATQLSKENEKAIREEAAKEALQKDIVDKEAEVQKAKIESDKAKKDREEFNKEITAATEAVAKNSQQREPERVVEKTIIKEAETRTGELRQTMEKELSGLRQAVIAAGSGKAHEDAVRDLETARVKHQTEIGKQTDRIKQATQRLEKIDTEINAPLAQIQSKTKELDDLMASKHAEVERAEKSLAIANTKTKEDFINTKQVRDAANARIKDIENSGKAYRSEIAKDIAQNPIYMSADDHAAQHIVEHHFDAVTKRKSSTDRLADIFKESKKEDKAH